MATCSELRQQVQKYIEDIESNGLYMSLLYKEDNGVGVAFQIYEPQNESKDFIKGMTLALNTLEDDGFELCHSYWMTIEKAQKHCGIVAFKVYTDDELFSLLKKVKEYFSVIAIYPSKVFIYSTFDNSLDKIKTGIQEQLHTSLEEVIKFVDALYETKTVDAPLELGYKFNDKSKYPADKFLQDNKRWLFERLHNDWVPTEIEKQRDHILDFVSNNLSSVDVASSEEDNTEYTAFMGAYA